MKASSFNRSLFANIEHVRVNVRDSEAYRELLWRVFPCFVQYPEGDVASSSSDVKALEWLRRNNLAALIEYFSRF